MIGQEKQLDAALPAAEPATPAPDLPLLRICPHAVVAVGSRTAASMKSLDAKYLAARRYEPSIRAQVGEAVLVLRAQR